MTARALLWLAALATAGSWSAQAIDLRERSESGTKQFIVYSEDVRLRQRVASFAEQVKTEVRDLLGENDLWKAPVVITLARATTLDQGEPPVHLRVAETQPGFKVEIQVKIGEDPSAVNLHRVLIRAVLLEYSYRRTGISAGQKIVDPPWWIVEGLYETARRRELGADSSLFRRMVETNRLPPIESFLVERPDEMGPTALAVDRALAMCLLESLVEQPDGKANLARLVRDWPQSDGDAAGLLARTFPAVGSGPVLQKWWTLSLARFASEDRYQGLTVEETEKALTSLVQFEMAVDAKGEKKTFGLADFAEFLKVPASHDLLTARHVEVVALGTKCNPLYRPLLANYEEIFAQLARGKTRGLRDRIAKADEARQVTARRIADIEDYLNWFEATQMKSRSGAFDNYLKTANDLSEQERKQRDLIGRYLDELEKEL